MVYNMTQAALRHSWGGHENAKMIIAELNCHVFQDTHNKWVFCIRYKPAHGVAEFRPGVYDLVVHEYVVSGDPTQGDLGTVPRDVQLIATKHLYVRLRRGMGTYSKGK